MVWESVWCGGVYGVVECMECGGVWSGGVYRVGECMVWGSVWWVEVMVCRSVWSVGVGGVYGVRECVECMKWGRVWSGGG